MQLGKPLNALKLCAVLEHCSFIRISALANFILTLMHLKDVFSAQQTCSALSLQSKSIN